MADIARNKQASYRYELLEKWEAGLVLQGSEVKSLRDGKAQLKDGYAALRDGEVWLYNVHIAPYPPATTENHEPERPRKLLMHRREIERLIGKTREKGLTLVPTRMYFKGSHAKVEIALAKGKDVGDKRRAIKEREMKREMERALCVAEGALEVRQVHPDAEQHEQAHVDDADREPVRGLDAVVVGVALLARLAVLPAPVGRRTPPRTRNRSRNGFGATSSSASIAPRPTNHIHGVIAAIARPPSNGTTGIRLKRLRKKPVNASACQNSSPVAIHSPAGIRHAIEPRIGPARPTRASAMRGAAERARARRPRRGTG